MKGDVEVTVAMRYISYLDYLKVTHSNPADGIVSVGQVQRWQEVG